jgi:predicted nucleotidyltransferase
MNTAKALFGGGAKSALLSTFCNRPNESFHVRELVREVGMGSGAVQRELSALLRLKLLRAERKGNRCFYRANTESSLFPDLQSIMVKTSLEAAPGVLKTALHSLKAKIRTAFVYGSVARNEAKPGSDIDVMIVGDATFAELVPRLAKAQAKLHREINPTIYTEPEFRKKLQSGNHFLNTVMSDKKLLVLGDTNAVQGLGHIQESHSASE